MRNNIIIKMMQIFAVIFWFTGLLLAQEILWQRVFNTGVEDWARAVTADRDRNIVVTGISAFQNSTGGCLTIKYNQNGDTVWTRWYDVNARGIITDNSGNIIIGGDRWNNDTTRIVFVKCDPSGSVLWSQTYAMRVLGGHNGHLASDSKNNIILVGTAYDNWGDFITLKYDTNGNLLWMRTYNGGWEDYAQDVAVDNSDNIIVTGYSNGDMDWDWCTIKYSSEGDILWIRRYDIALTDWAFGVATDQDDNVIVVGETHQLLPGTGGQSGMVVKYSPQGDTLWTKIFTDTLQHAEVVTFADVTTDDQSNIYLTGEYFYWSDTGTSNNRSDYYIVKCDLYGDTLWTVTYNYDNEDEVSGIALDNEKNIIVTGTTNHRYSWFEQNFLTIKLKDEIVDKIDEIHLFPHEFVLSQNYPNPFNALTTIRYEIPKAAWVKIALYDLLGCKIGILVNEYQRPGVYKTLWDAADFSSGLYLVQMAAGSFTSARKLMLVK